MQYPGTNGYWMPRNTPRLLFVQKAAVSWNDRLLDAKAYTKAVVCLKSRSTGILEQQATGCQGCCFVVKKNAVPYSGMTCYWMLRHTPRLFVC
jgi:hypothetical protein